MKIYNVWQYFGVDFRSKLIEHIWEKKEEKWTSV